MQTALRALSGSVAFGLVMLVTACATPFERPESVDDALLRERARTVAEDGIRVSAAVPTVEESKAIFGVDLYAKGIEPVWLEVENGTQREILFLPTGMDAEYFAPLEVAFGFRRRFSRDSIARLDEHIESLNFRDPIPAGATVSGFVFTNQDKGAKVLNVDLLSRAWSKSVTLIVPIPGHEEAAERLMRIAFLGAVPGLSEVEDESRLRELLEQLPCCASSKDGEPGEPLNVVFIGDLTDFAPGAQRRNYRYSEVPPLYVFERPQDLSAAKQARWVAAQPHVLRLWLTKIRFRGKEVWIGQTSTPLGGRFASRAGDNRERLIEPDVDEARIDLVQDMLYSQALAKVGFVKGVGKVLASNPRATFRGGTYHTDGLRAVLHFAHEGVSLAEIEFFPWERLADHYRKQLSRVDGD